MQDGGRLAVLRATVVTLALSSGAIVLPGGARSLQAQETTTATHIDAVTLRRDVSVLAADSMEGRQAGTPGSARARTYLLRRFREIGLQPFDTSFARDFTFQQRSGTELKGVNLVGFIRGTAQPERAIVITAHYDHVGIRNGEVFNGADDNASGTAGILALAQYFVTHAPAHTMIFAALDAEESGLRGARAFLASPPVPQSRMVLNVNLDMVGRNEKNELYVAGTYHTPALLGLVEGIAAQAPVKLIPGHDRPGLPSGDDWTNSSDHGPFHAAGIPFLYFGVEDHADYHRASDEVDRLLPADFHARAVETVLMALLRLDREVDTILAGRGRD